MSAPTTRRDLLRFGTSAAAYAAGAAIVTGGVALASEVKSAGTTVSPELSRHIARYKIADEALDHWYDTVRNPAASAYNVERLAVPHTEVAVQGYRNVLNEDTPPCTFSTANRLDMARCKGIMSIAYDRQSRDPRWQETYRAARRLTIAGKWRDRQIARIQARWVATGIDRKEDELWVPINAASAAILAFPVRSAADLTAKLDHMHLVGTCEDDAERFQQIVRADVLRLAGGEA